MEEKLDEAIRSIGDPELVTRRLLGEYRDEINQRLGGVEARHNFKMDIVRQMEEIQSIPCRAAFYTCLQTKLNAVFTAVLALSSGMIQRTTGLKEDLVLGGISILGDMIPFPGAGAVASLLGWATGTAVDAVKDRQNNQTLSFGSGQNAITGLRSTERLVERVARTLTQRYSDQIDLLSESGAKMIAQCYAGRVMMVINGPSLLSAGKDRVKRAMKAMKRKTAATDSVPAAPTERGADVPLHLFLCSAIVSVKADKRLGFLKHIVSTATPSVHRKWTEDGVLSHSGIKVKAVTLAPPSSCRTLPGQYTPVDSSVDTAVSVWRYYSLPDVTRAEKYGYRSMEHDPPIVLRCGCRCG
eukprot:TRINITY_DN3179_c0_g1_i3.p1 TRINITY_DN3179_c0_g1~~TRINITY_DN3179_c0_g1_i3.p1  ORF type:complete len:355 (-),score=52.14 TRINITY_DN3179_c0_g1_i3:78-1142(-)